MKRATCPAMCALALLVGLPSLAPAQVVARSAHAHAHAPAAAATPAVSVPAAPPVAPLATVPPAAPAAAAPARPSAPLTDPTQPPAELLRPAAGEAAAAPAPPSTPQLQSVLISTRQGGRRLAVIDGQTVRRGETFKGAVLVSVSETEVVLLRGREKQVLKLRPKSPPAAER